MIVALDIGTTSAKAALFRRDGTCLALERAPIPSIIGANPVEHEIDPRAWTEAVDGMLARLAAAVPGGLAGVQCIAVSGNGPTLLPVDARGEPLCNAITWMDRRAAEESALAEPLLGRSLDPAYNLPKVLWLKNHRPALYEATRRFSSCPEYICARLCGEWVSFLPAEGYQAIIWDRASIRLLGLDEDKFPPFAGLGIPLGGVTQAASARTGLPAGIPVVGGGPDFIASLIGTATTAPRRACDRSGTSEGINLCWDKPHARDPRLLFMPHVVAPYENISGVISATGRAVSWFMGIEGLGAADHQGFFEAAASAPAGAGQAPFPSLFSRRARAALGSRGARRFYRLEPQTWPQGDGPRRGRIDGLRDARRDRRDGIARRLRGRPARHRPARRQRRLEPDQGRHRPESPSGCPPSARPS